MNEVISPKPGDLTEQQRDALRDCGRFQAGAYVWKPQTMRRLAAMTLTYETANGAYALTEEGVSMVQEMRGEKR